MLLCKHCYLVTDLKAKADLGNSQGDLNPVVCTVSKISLTADFPEV